MWIYSLFHRSFGRRRPSLLDALPFSPQVRRPKFDLAETYFFFYLVVALLSNPVVVSGP